MYLVGFGHFDGAFVGDLPLLLHLALVSYHVYADVLRRVLLHLRQPLAQVREGLLARHVVSQEHAVRTAVEDTRHRLERLLARSVPNLQLNHLILYFDAERAELDPDGDLMFSFKLVVHDSLHKARFADACVADNDKFEEVILGGQCAVVEHLVRHLAYILYVFRSLHLFNL